MMVRPGAVLRIWLRPWMIKQRRRAGPPGNVSARLGDDLVLHAIARATAVAASSVAFADR